MFLVNHSKNRNWVTTPILFGQIPAYLPREDGSTTTIYNPFVKWDKPPIMVLTCSYCTMIETPQLCSWIQTMKTVWTVLGHINEAPSIFPKKTDFLLNFDEPMVVMSMAPWKYRIVYASTKLHGPPFLIFVEGRCMSNKKLSCRTCRVVSTCKPRSWRLSMTSWRSWIWHVGDIAGQPTTILSFLNVRFVVLPKENHVWLWNLYRIFFLCLLGRSTSTILMSPM